MKIRFAILFLLCCILYIACPFSVSAHSGRTDSNGGHVDTLTGSYHYHHGYPEHQHEDLDGDGKPDCKYTFKPIGEAVQADPEPSPREENPVPGVALALGAALPLSAALFARKKKKS